MKSNRLTATNSPSSYRWINLLAIVPIIISTEIMWLSLAPISSIAEKYYGVNSMSIALFSMSYMIMYILFCIPASWFLDKFGYRKSLILGALITSVFGLVRVLFADHFTIVLLAQFCIAIGQPFLINISTKVAANWFPISERSTATGILTMAQYIGFIVPMVVAPAVAESHGLPQVFMIFAVIAVVSAIISIIFTKEKPLVPPEDFNDIKEGMSLSSVKKLFANKGYMFVLLICFVSMGVFNTILTLIESILVPRGISLVQSGAIGAVFVICGVIGAVVIPLISDRLGVRIPILTVVISLLIPLYLGLTFVNGFILLCILAGVAGFSIMGAAPILFQHGSEVAYPIKEGTSLGFIILMGQISGVAFVYVFESLAGSTGAILIPMLLIVAITVLQLPFVLRMKESKLIQKD